MVSERMQRRIDVLLDEAAVAANPRWLVANGRC
jgi:hypothetical protein